jgi:hypothetical protein
VTAHKRGRSRKHSWIEFQNLENDASPDAQYLRWASVNNPALAECAHSGCQRCGGKNFRLRHDKKFENIRFYCPECRFETSFHIIHPKKSLRSIEIYDARGILIGIKTLDDYHGRTSRENADSRVMISEQKLDLGGEWFDGVSGTNSQSRYLTREEILKRIENRRMRRLMEAALEEIEHEEQEDRALALKADISRRRYTD